MTRVAWVVLSVIVLFAFTISAFGGAVVVAQETADPVVTETYTGTQYYESPTITPVVIAPPVDDPGNPPDTVPAWVAVILGVISVFSGGLVSVLIFLNSKAAGKIADLAEVLYEAASPEQQTAWAERLKAAEGAAMKGQELAITATNAFEKFAQLLEDIRTPDAVHSAADTDGKAAG